MPNTLRNLYLILLFAFSIYASGDPNPYGDSNYLALSLNRSYPHSAMEEHLALGSLRPTLAIRYFTKGSWILGITGQTSELREKSNQQSLVLWKVAQETIYNIRIYHPFYFGVGGRIFYLLPSKGHTVPLSTDATYQTEVGISAEIMLNYYFARGWVAVLTFERWRGTGTNRMHGFEYSVGIGTNVGFMFR